MALSFVHAADLHLDSPFKGLVSGAFPAARDATFRAFARVVDLCLRERVDLLLLAGDLFDARDRSVRARLFLRDQLLRLDEAGIRTFIVHGNHDPLSGDAGTLRLPPSVTVFGPGWEEVVVRDASGIRYRVQGVSYPRERVVENLSARFGRQGPEPSFGLLHANVGALDAHANYAPCTVDDLARTGLDYWALGHVHTRQTIALPGGALAVYPGNPQGRHVREAGERGCMLGKLEDGVASVRFVAVDCVRWHRLTLNLSEVVTLEGLVERWERLTADLGEGVDAHAVVLGLEGRGPLSEELRGAEALTGLQERLAASVRQRSAPVFLTALRNESGPALDLDALAGVGLPGAILAAAEAAGRDAGLHSALWEVDELQALEAALKAVGVGCARGDLTLIQAAALEVLEGLVGGPA